MIVHCSHLDVIRFFQFTIVNFNTPTYHDQMVSISSRPRELRNLIYSGGILSLIMYINRVKHLHNEFMYVLNLIQWLHTIISDSSTLTKICVVVSGRSGNVWLTPLQSNQQYHMLVGSCSSANAKSTTKMAHEGVYVISSQTVRGLHCKSIGVDDLDMACTGISHLLVSSINSTGTPHVHHARKIWNYLR